MKPQTLSGLLQDEAGAVLSGMTLSLRSRTFARNVTTDGSGHYNFGEIPVGVYRVQVNSRNAHPFCAPEVHCDQECVLKSRLKVNPRGFVTVD